MIGENLAWLLAYVGKCDVAWFNVVVDKIGHANGTVGGTG